MQGFLSPKWVDMEGQVKSPPPFLRHGGTPSILWIMGGGHVYGGGWCSVCGVQTIPFIFDDNPKNMCGF